MPLKTEQFDNIILNFPDRLRIPFAALPCNDKQSVTEIRLRACGPVALSCGETVFYMDKSGRLTNNTGDPLIAEKRDVESVFEQLCGFSVYAHQDEINNGYISVKGGHRVGVCGRAVYSGGEIISVRDISSLNIRLSRQVIGIADRYAELLRPGAIIAGPPSSGKTTMLRDIARSLSSRGTRVAVIDSRGEIAASSGGISQYDLGFNCDVLTGYTKSDGIDIAVRTLNPQVVVFDELSAIHESEKILGGFFCGVGFICSVHAGNEAELYEREITAKLLSSGAVKNILFLKNIHTRPEVIPVRRPGVALGVRYA